jgi:DNA mismatch repair protein MutS
VTITFQKIGDFYEAAGEEARVVAKELQITLTKSRSGEAMAGIPYHRIYRDVEELRAKGHQVTF